MNESTFRSVYPEFSDTTAYSSVAVNQWLTLATTQLTCGVWGDLLDTGIGLYAAHWLAVSAKNQKAAARGAVPGGEVGVLTSKSAGGLSASFDTGSVTNEGAGHWNMTTYGLQFWDLSRGFGAGGIQLGLGDGGVDVGVFSGWPRLL